MTEKEWEEQHGSKLSSPATTNPLDVQHGGDHYKTRGIQPIEYIIPAELFNKLCILGIIDKDNVRDSNIGDSDYSKRLIQPWSIWIEYSLDPWDADIIKRVLRNKASDEPMLDYQKIKHICDEKIRQLSVS